MLLGIKWRQLAHHVIDNQLLNGNQFGCLPGREALTPAFMEELQWEIARSSRRSLLRSDFDATSCFDQIIPSIASLVSRSYGMHRTLCIVHARFLEDAKYLLRTKLGISEESYSHCEEYPIYGTGQGSSNSPVLWALISSKAFDVQEATTNGAIFLSPCRTKSVRVFMVGFVDDTYGSVNDFEADVQDPQSLLARAQFDAQRWHDLLFRTGGALEVPKCKFQLAHYNFTQAGTPYLHDFKPDQVPVQVQEASSNDKVNLKYIGPRQERRILGCYKSPSGSFKTALEVITANAMKKSELPTRRGVLNPRMAWRYYHSIFLPSVTYSFATNSIPEQKLLPVQNRSTRRFLNAFGYCKNSPKEVVYGPQEFGGIGCRSFYDEQGAAQIEMIMKHLRHGSDVGKQLEIAIAWLQRQSGLGCPVLGASEKYLQHLDSVYLKSVATYLDNIKGKLVFEDDFSAPLQREGDFHIME
jgi:hypothetical protein